jgi:hypothetical protein
MTQIDEEETRALAHVSCLYPVFAKHKALQIGAENNIPIAKRPRDVLLKIPWDLYRYYPDVRVVDPRVTISSFLHRHDFHSPGLSSILTAFKYPLPHLCVSPTQLQGPNPFPLYLMSFTFHREFSVHLHEL